MIATRVHRRFCMELHRQFPDYSADLWGITASDSPNGYVVWGGPPATGPIDGTVAPHAAGGSLPFLPQETMQVLRTIRNRYPQTWSCYGFVDALNPLKNWYDTDVVGIDAGSHHGHGGECPHRLHLESFYGESRSSTRHAAGGIQALQGVEDFFFVNVQHCFELRGLVRSMRMRVSSSNFGRCSQQSVERFQLWHFDIAPLQCFQHTFGRDISHQRILCERAPA